MAIEKYIIDKSDLPALLRGEDLAIQPKGNIKGFCVEITGDLTNGDVIKAVFGKENVGQCGDSYYIGACEFSESWWNTPYSATNIGYGE